MSVEAVLRMRWMPINRSVAKRAEGFIRYVQFRDQHPDSAEAHDVDELIRYVKHRDATSPGGRLFDDGGPSGDEQRTKVVDLIERSSRAALDGGGPSSSTDDRAYYQIIISPRDARGLDLKAMTRATMRQLGRDSGSGGLPAWVAGEHRNTAHPHTHVVLAAKREVAPGRFRTLLVTKARRERMHQALHAEMARQRETRSLRYQRVLGAADLTRGSAAHSRQALGPSPRLQVLASSPVADRHPALTRMIRTVPTARIASIAGRLSRHYREEAEREARRRRHAADDQEQRRSR